MLNLTHRDGHDAPTALEPGRPYAVRVALRAAGYRFAPGHRIRVSIASNSWPVLWPSPFPGELAIHHAGSRLVLPTIPPGDGSLGAPPFKTSPAGLEDVGGGSAEPPVWRILEDVIAGTVTVSTNDAGEGRPARRDRDLQRRTARDDRVRRRPGPRRMANAVHYWLDQDGFRIDARATGETTSTETDFRMVVRLEVDLDDERFFERDWDETIPRRLV